MQGPISNPSRFDIINWINDALLIHITKIEQLGSGSIYCHLLDAAYPQRIPLYKVKWDARLQVDFLHNFKILQTSFQILHIEKAIQVQRLVKAKFQDNFQFIQWMYGTLYELIEQNSKDYEPLKRRKYSKLYLEFCGEKKTGKKVNVTLHSKNHKENHSNINEGSVHDSESIRDMKSSTSSMASMQTPRSTLTDKNYKYGQSNMYGSTIRSRKNLHESMSSQRFNEPHYQEDSMKKQSKKVKMLKFEEDQEEDYKFQTRSQLKYTKAQKNALSESVAQMNECVSKKTKGISVIQSGGLRSRRSISSKQNKLSFPNMMKNVSIVESEEEQDPFAVI